MTATTLEHPARSDKNESSAIRLSTVLVPIDFSPASRNALKYAFRFAQEFGAEVTMLHVLEPPPSPTFVAIPGAVAFSESDLSTAETNLRALVAAARHGHVKRPQWIVRAGLPSHEIVEVAKNSDVDLIVMATQGYTGWKHFCIGRTAERVVRAAPCPVLVVREKEHEFC